MKAPEPGRGALSGPHAPAPPGERRLTRAEFQALADAPPEAEWAANIRNGATRRAYANDIGAFMAFAGMIVSQPVV